MLVLVRRIQSLPDLHRKNGAEDMKRRPQFVKNPDKYDIATEVLSSAIRVLQAAGFYEGEILRLFAQVANKRERIPLYLEPLTS
jgi:hypothetical protein